MVVREFMTTIVRSAAPDASLSALATTMKRLNVGLIPICGNEGQLLGIVTDRDIVMKCVAEELDPRKCRAREIMTRAPATAGPDMAVNDALHLMAEAHVHRLPVTENNALVGILSIDDVAVSSTEDHALAETVRALSAAPHRPMAHAHLP